MARFRLMPRASADIMAIWDHIAADNPAAAGRTVDLLFQRIERLAEHPLIGRPRADLKPGLYSFPSDSYLIFHTYGDDLVEVVRVLHGARDLPTLFETES